MKGTSKQPVVTTATPVDAIIDLIKFTVGSNARTWRMIALMISSAALIAVLLTVAALAGNVLGVLGTAIAGGIPTLGAIIASAARHRRSSPAASEKPHTKLSGPKRAS